VGRWRERGGDFRNNWVFARGGISLEILGHKEWQKGGREGEFLRKKKKNKLSARKRDFGGGGLMGPYYEGKEYTTPCRIIPY